MILHYEDNIMSEAIIEKETLKQTVKPPPKYQVVMVNDDYTTMEFVVECLASIFSKSQEQAFQIMLEVHEKGKAVVGVYNKEIAETKQYMAMQKAREEEHPLIVEINPCE